MLVILAIWLSRSSCKSAIIDGGVIDNIPWYQFIEDVPCDEIVIVGCNPVPNWNDVERKREWTLKNRLLRVIKSSLQYDDRKDDGVFEKESVTLSGFGKLKDIKNDPPLVVPYQEPCRWPKRVLVIAPDTPLGNFLTGTLNFSTKVARNRLAAGHQKASRIIEESNLAQ